MKIFRIPRLILLASVTALLCGQANATTVGVTGSYTSTGCAETGGCSAVSGEGNATFDSSGTMTVIANWTIEVGDPTTAITSKKEYTGSINDSTWTSDGNFVITYEECTGVEPVCSTMGDLPHTNSGTVIPFSLNICTGGPNWLETDITPYKSLYGNDLLWLVTVTTNNSVAVVDADSDCVADLEDFYPDISLDGRTDTDRDGMPDDCDAACIRTGMLADTDDDGDGYIDTADNCRLIANPEQGDIDTDMIGDLCDNCRAITNPLQEDANNDSCGDVCIKGGCAGPICTNP